MVDGRTTASVDLTDPLVVVDLSAVLPSPALPMAMTCVAARQATLSANDGAQRMMVLDASWRMGMSTRTGPGVLG